MSAVAAGGVLAPGRRSLVLGIVLSVLLIGFESLAVATVLPQAARALGGLGLYGWSFSAFFLGFMVSTVALGAWADHSGPTRPYLAAVLTFGAGLLLAGLSHSMAAFILGRAVQGFGGGALIAVAYLAVNRSFPDELRSRVLALMSGAWVLPGLLGPLAASALAAATSWRGVFLGLLPLLLLAAGLTLPALRRLPAPGTPVRVSRLLAVAVTAAGVTLLLSALSRPELLPRLGLGAAGAALALPALRRLYGPSAWRLRTPLHSGFALRLLLTFGFFGAESLLPLSLQTLRGQSLWQSGLALTWATLGWTLGSFLNSRLDERFSGGRRHLSAGLGALLVGLSLGLCDLLLHSALPAWTVSLSWALGGLGMGFAFQSHTLVVLQNAPAGQEGLTSGNLQLSDMLGSALGAGLGGALVASQGVGAGSAWSLGGASAAVLLAALVARGLRGPI
ncbi:MAG: MFS transporter [Deinococcus sp.]